MGPVAALLMWLSMPHGLVLTSMCPSADKGLIEADPHQARDLCIAQATRHAPASMLVLANGSCLLLGICATLEKPSMPLYRLMRPEEKLPLLRITSNADTTPMDLLKDGDEDAFQLSAFGENLNLYKSPLVSVHPTPFSNVHLVLMEDGSVKVNLTFNTITNRIADPDWFAKHSLQDSKPWNLADLKHHYVSFSAFRYFSSSFGDVRMQFYIGKNFDTLHISSFDQLPFFTTVAPNLGHYRCVWKSNPDSTSMHLNQEFRLYGTLKKPHEFRFYQRVP